MNTLRLKAIKKKITNECHLKGIRGVSIEDACNYAEDLLRDGGLPVSRVLSGVEYAKNRQNLMARVCSKVQPLPTVN